MRQNISKFWFYLIINVIVSALTTIIILSIWTANRQDSPAYSLLLTPQSAEEINFTDAEIEQPTLPAMDSPTLEIKYVYGFGDLQTEFIQIHMIGTDELWLTNWQISNGAKHVYTFPRLQLNSGGTVNLYTKLGVDSVTDLYWGESEPVWQSGDTVTLLDSEGNVRATYLVE
ncbi:MAG: lamin tail domain-containing protein [Anaerolineaceae bacterium]|nr:lamin tail domain-containing protein [Anaerolineaceae bacterium]